jgi:hypothetical protein
MSSASPHEGFIAVASDAPLSGLHARAGFQAGGSPLVQRRDPGRSFDVQAAELRRARALEPPGGCDGFFCCAAGGGASQKNIWDKYK